MGGRFQRLAIVLAAVLTTGPALAQTAPAASVRPGTAPVEPGTIPLADGHPLPVAIAEESDRQVVARPRLIMNPTWQRRATPEYPAAALANGLTEGAATLRCALLPDGRLADCVVVEEDPAGQGFGEAVVAAARRSRVSPRVVDGAAEGSSVQFTTRLVAPTGEPTPPPSAPLTVTEIVPVPAPPQEIGSAVRHLPGQNQPPGPPPAPARPSMITNPSWARPPQPEYPALAMANGVTEGRAVIRCRVLRTGFLTDCQIAQETPTGQGFGAAALAAAAVAQISRRTVEGAADNATANIPIRFVAAD